MTKPALTISKEEMIATIKEEIFALEAHAKQLSVTVDLLKRTSSSDANMAVMKEVKDLSDSLKTVNVASSIFKIKKSLSGRLRTLVRELEK